MVKAKLYKADNGMYLVAEDLSDAFRMVKVIAEKHDIQVESLQLIDAENLVVSDNCLRSLFGLLPPLKEIDGERQSS